MDKEGCKASIPRLFKSRQVKPRQGRIKPFATSRPKKEGTQPFPGTGTNSWASRLEADNFYFNNQDDISEALV